MPDFNKNALGTIGTKLPMTGAVKACMDASAKIASAGLHQRYGESLCRFFGGAASPAQYGRAGAFFQAIVDAAVAEKARREAKPVLLPGPDAACASGRLASLQPPHPMIPKDMSQYVCENYLSISAHVQNLDGAVAFFSLAAKAAGLRFTQQNQLSMSVDGPAGQISEDSCLNKLSTPPAPEANDAVMNQYDRQFVCGLLSWPNTTDQELQYAIGIWSVRAPALPAWPTAVQLAKDELARRAKGTGGGIDVGGLKIPGIDTGMPPVEDNMPAPKVATITAAQVPTPLTPAFCMANADDGLTGDLATARCAMLTSMETPLAGLKLYATSVATTSPNLAIMAGVQAAFRSAAPPPVKEPEEDMPEETPPSACLPNGTTSASSALCCSKHVDGGKCADVPTPGKKTSPWLIGTLVVGGLAVVGLGAWAAMRKPEGQRFSNPVAPRPQSGYAYEYTGKSWRTSSGERWEDVMYTPSGEETYVGMRRLGGTDTPCHVWKTDDGFIAQTVAMTGGA